MRHLTFIVLILLQLSAGIWIQASETPFQLSSNNGLSNSSITCITQSSNGLMWFGTWDGLNCYNGRETKVFKPNPTDPRSISNNIVRQVVEQDAHTLWVATDLGINKLDMRDWQFTPYLFGYQTKNIVKERSFLLAINRSSQLFCSVYGSGLFYYTPSGDFVNIPLPSINSSIINNLFFDIHNTLWVHTEQGLTYKVYLNMSEQRVVLEDVEQVAALSHHSALHYVAQSDHIYFHNAKSDIIAYDLATQSPSTLISDPSLGSQTLNEVISREGKLYFATTAGLFLYDRGNQQLVNRFASSSILSLFIGTQQVLWLGTDGQGVFKVTPTSERFPSFDSSNLPLIGHYPIRSFYESTADNLWVGTKGGGLYQIEHLHHPTKQSIERYAIKQGLLSNSIYALERATRGDIWIGTDGEGLNYYHAKSDQIRRLTIPSNTKGLRGLRSVYALYQQNDSILWVGTSGNGLFRLRVTEGEQRRIVDFTHYSNHNGLSNNIVYSILPEGSSVIWIGTRGGGLNRLDIPTSKIEVFRYSKDNPDSSLSNDDVLSLARDRNGMMWIGTSMGLNRLDHYAQAEATFTHFTQEKGMPNSTIHGIVCDQDNHIWVSTNRGIAKITQPKQEIINYYYTDGLQSNEFSDGAYHKSRYSNLIYMGGVNGFNAFNPSAIERLTFMPEMLLNSFFIDNQVTQIGHHTDKQGVLTLDWDQKSFGFNFAILDYIHSQKCELAYRLVDHNDEWIELGSSYTLTFSKLPAGSYILEVKYSNADKMWSPQIYRLPIRIFPPWWMSPVAFVIYTILLIAFIYFLYRFMRLNVELRHSRDLEQIEKHKIEEIHQAKLRFFTNIAHEFSNSLSLIYGPAQLLLRKESDNAGIRKHVQTIRSNAERMQQLIQQLMEFRKVETGHLDLHIEKVDVVELSGYIIDNFEELSEQKNICFEVDIASDLPIWHSDRAALEKVIFNLLSNAFKYTPDQETISLRISVEDNQLVCLIKNTGVGVPTENQTLIFDRFRVLDNLEKQAIKGYETRTGIGLAVCKNLVDLMQGTLEIESDGLSFTAFIISLPMLELNENSSSIDTTPAPVVNIPIVESATSVASSTQKPTVLVVDDDSQIRSLIADTLSDHYSIVEAANGKEALMQLAQHRVVLVISDVMMPIMSGIDLVKELKTHKDYVHIPVILLSSLRAIENQIEGIAVGANAYLPKPFHPQHLEALVARLIENNKTLLVYADSPQSRVEMFEGRKLQKADMDFIMALTTLIMDNLENEELNQDFLAQKMLMSKVKFYRKIKEVVETTPTDFIRTLRLREAEKLLKTTSLTIQEIMFRCGFNNKAYFYREFTKLYQCTPKEYRKEASAGL